MTPTRNEAAERLRRSLDRLGTDDEHSRLLRNVFDAALAAEREPLLAALARLHRFSNAVMSSNPKDAKRISFNDLRQAATVLGQSKSGEYGDERDPWPEDTAEQVARALIEQDGRREQ